MSNDWGGWEDNSQWAQPPQHDYGHTPQQQQHYGYALSLQVYWVALDIPTMDSTVVIISNPSNTNNSNHHITPMGMVASNSKVVLLIPILEPKVRI